MSSEYIAVQLQYPFLNENFLTQKRAWRHFYRIQLGWIGFLGEFWIELTKFLIVVEVSNSNSYREITIGSIPLRFIAHLRTPPYNYRKVWNKNFFTILYICLCLPLLFLFIVNFIFSFLTIFSR